MNASFRLSGFLGDNASLYLTDGPYNYEKAFYALRPAVLQKDTEILLKLDLLCWQLAGLLWVKHNKPEQWQAYESQADSVWSDLEKLSQQFTQKPFWSFALPEHPTNFPVKNHAVVSHLERTINRQENSLKEKRSKRDFQQKSQPVLPVLEKSIQHLEWSIKHRQKELRHLRRIVEPPSFFKIQRQVNNEHLIEEISFTVQVSITNKGGHVQMYVMKKLYPTHYKPSAEKKAFRSILSLDKTVNLLMNVMPLNQGNTALLIVVLNMREESRPGISWMKRF